MGEEKDQSGEIGINTLHNRHKITKLLVCNNEYLVKVHQVAGLATKWNEEPHTSFTLRGTLDDKQGPLKQWRTSIHYS